jgi:uncharacterized radical SAM protein YgiQ
MSFLPVNREDMKKRGWDYIDFLYISGDAYVDHPSFGHAIITKLLEDESFRVGIIAQPDWNDVNSIMKMGKPELGVLISSGVIDSMVNHYTAAKKPRGEDLYSPGGIKGKRPDRAVIVYSNLARRAFKGVPVIIGGIEASLRRFAHYDYWQDKVRNSILKDSKADLLVYGMGERPIIEIAGLLKKGVPMSSLTSVRGTCYITNDEEKINKIKNLEILDSFEKVAQDKKAYTKAHIIQETEQDPVRGKTLVQKHGDRFVVQNPPADILCDEEMDRIYGLPYMRMWHTDYDISGGVPAFKEVKFSITSHRGCFGSCSFCSLGYHQGRIIQKRSHESIIREAELLTRQPDFKGYINDVGGATANFRNVSCREQMIAGICKDKKCLYPKPCNNLTVSHSDYLSLLRKLRKLKNIKKVFIRSGIRFDYLMLDKNDAFFREMCKHHISGQLKVAPEHISKNVLRLMKKPENSVYRSFVKKFKKINEILNKKQYLVPYFISGHPGSKLSDAIYLAEFIKEMNYKPEQVQQFYPTPGNMSTTMYYTGLNPETLKEVYIPKTDKEKAMQRALLQFQKPENYKLVKEALYIEGRMDLTGHGKKCLIKNSK